MAAHRNGGPKSGIALSSIFGKVLDLIFLSKFTNNLCTSNISASVRDSP